MEPRANKGYADRHVVISSEGGNVHNRHMKALRLCQSFELLISGTKSYSPESVKGWTTHITKPNRGFIHRTGCQDD